jgi:hypothetical protein
MYPILTVHDDYGRPLQIGPEHPDYQRHYARHVAAQTPRLMPTRLLGAGVMLFAGYLWWCFLQVVLVTGGSTDLRYAYFGPLGVLAGLLLIVKPEWGSPTRSSSSLGQKVGVGVLLVLWLIATAVNWYLAESSRA